MSTVESATLTKEIVVALAALLGGGAAIWGLTSWRSELRTQRVADFSARLMVVIGEFRDTFEWARNTSVGVKGDDVEAFETRLKRLLAPAKELRKLEWESKALLPDNVTAHLTRLLDYYHQTRIAFQRHVWLVTGVIQPTEKIQLGVDEWVWGVPGDAKCKEVDAIAASIQRALQQELRWPHRRCFRKYEVSLPETGE